MNSWSLSYTVPYTVKGVPTPSITHFSAHTTSMVQSCYCALLRNAHTKNWLLWSYFLKLYQPTVPHSSSSFSPLSFISSPPFRLVTSSHIRFASSFHSVPTPSSIDAARFDKGWLHPRGENISHQESLAHYRLLCKSGILVRPPAFAVPSCG